MSSPGVDRGSVTAAESRGLGCLLGVAGVMRGPRAGALTWAVT